MLRYLNRNALRKFRAMMQEWIRIGLAQTGNSGKGLARALGVHDSVVSRMLRGRRRIKPHEIPIIAKYLGMDPPNNSVPSLAKDGGKGAFKSTQLANKIPIVGIMSTSTWREEGGVLLDRATIPVADPRLKGFDQYALEHEQGPPGRYAIFIDYFAYRPRPLDGDTVLVRRHRNGLVQEFIRVIRLVADGVRLISPDNDKDVLAYPANNGAEQIEIRGLLVARYESASF